MVMSPPTPILFDSIDLGFDGGSHNHSQLLLPRIIATVWKEIQQPAHEKEKKTTVDAARRQ